MLCHCTCVERDKGFLFSGAILMNRLGDDVFSCSGLTCNQHAGVGWSNAFESLHYALHTAAGVDQIFEAKSLVQSLIQFDILESQADRLHGLFRDGLKSFGGDRFFQEIKRALLHGLSLIHI